MKLAFLVEGNMDEIFISNVVPKIFKQYNFSLSIHKYSQQKDVKVGNYIKSIKEIKDYSYFFLADSDQYDITRRKNELIKRIPSLDNSKIIIAKKEIESWYIAGVTPSLSKKLFPKEKYEDIINMIKSPETVKKEKFNAMLPIARPRMPTIIEILKNYSIDQAQRNSSTFAYFVETINTMMP
jgi:hypothetical protein